MDRHSALCPKNGPCCPKQLRTPRRLSSRTDHRHFFSDERDPTIQTLVSARRERGKGGGCRHRTNPRRKNNRRRATLFLGHRSAFSHRSRLSPSTRPRPFSLEPRQSGTGNKDPDRPLRPVSRRMPTMRSWCGTTEKFSETTNRPFLSIPPNSSHRTSGPK